MRDLSVHDGDGCGRAVIFFVVSLLLGVSFFSRHIAGMYYTHFQYSCLVYNPRSVRGSPPADYDFLPDDASWDETRAYARWTNEVLRGEWGGATLASFAPFLTISVPRQPLWLRDRLGVAVLAGMAALPHSSVQRAFLAADFLFTIGAALSLLYLCCELRPSVSFAVAATCAVMAFNWQDLLNFVHFLHGARQEEAIFLRTPYPQFSTIVLCLFLLSLIRVAKAPSIFKVLVFIAALDLNFYTYFYSWTFALAIAGSAVLVLAFKFALTRVDLNVSEAIHQKRTLLGLLFGTGVAFILAFPVWGGIVQKAQATQDTFLRVGGTLGHRPELRYSSVLLILLLALLLWKNCSWKNRWPAIAFLLASLFVMNIQVLIGSTIQPRHWTGYYIQPILLVLILDLCWQFFSGRERMWRTVSIVLLTAALLTNIYKFSVGARQAIAYNRRDPAFEQLLDVLRNPVLRDYGFLSNDVYLSVVLPAYIEQKPLMPWYMDPMTDKNLAALQNAAEGALDPEIQDSNFDPDASDRNTQSTSIPLPSLTLRPDRILFVISAHRPFSSLLLAHRHILLKNSDFVVLGPADD